MVDWGVMGRGIHFLLEVGWGRVGWGGVMCTRNFLVDALLNKCGAT